VSRLIDIEVATETVWISFPYDPELVECVKSLPRRRWDASRKRWAVPAEDAVEAIALLEEYRFSLSPRMRAYWRDNDLARDLRALREGRGDGLTVTELNRKVSRTLRMAMPDDIWVTGELLGFDPGRHRSGHAYFELVEMRDERVSARVSAVLFERELKAILKKIERESGGRIEMRDGLEVRLRCRVDFYEEQGRFQVRVSDFDVAYARGKIEQAREKILRKLEQEGIREQNLRLAVPRVPLRIGLITSAGSDAHNDFIDELNRSPWAFRVVLHDAHVQGKEAEWRIVEALEYFAARAEAFDVVAIVRGGGARSDLSAFDSLAIGRSVCQLGVKVICGVGHHLDRSVLDFVSESLKTPTAAANHLVERVDAYMRRLAESRQTVATAAQTRVEEASSRLGRISRSIVAGARMGLGQNRAALDSARQRVSRESHRVMLDAIRRTDAVQGQVDHAVSRRLLQASRQLDETSDRLEFERVQLGLRRRKDVVASFKNRLDRAAKRRVETQRIRLDGAEREVKLADPRRVLERGFAIVRTGGRVVAARDLKKADEVELQFFDGRVRARVEEQINEDADE